MFGMRKNLSLVFAALAAILAAAPRSGAGVFSPEGDRVDLSQSLPLEKYMMTGTALDMEMAFERLESFKVSESFRGTVERVNRPLVILMIGMMYCPDCGIAFAYMEAMSRINPLITARYIPRDPTPGARDFMNRRTGVVRTPQIFIVEPDGAVRLGAYVETPARVTALLAAAASDEERKSVFADFRAGIYDEDVQDDLASLIDSALRP
ncbi:MAG: thioredoxin family protein [Synergistaceae bacterium]|jgi:hypothetical protein|nr:thioredoxin family protein [Synergistaceae bacterium]